MRIQFPKTITKPFYYKIHATYLLNIFTYLGHKVESTKDTSVSETSFVIFLDEKKVLVDFSDFSNPPILSKNIDFCIKFHYNEKGYDDSRIIPFTPVSFYDWDEYFRIQQQIQYKSSSSLVLNCQRPYAGAKERRENVQAVLNSTYGDCCDTTCNYTQEDYWKLSNNCLCHVFVPGARNDMLDRGQIQYMAFGCCTISPYLSDMLPYNKKIIPGIHYVSCSSDYLDLVERIEWIKDNKEKAIEIGKNAKRLFEETSTPGKLWQWIHQINQKS